MDNPLSKMSKPEKENEGVLSPYNYFSSSNGWSLGSQTLKPPRDNYIY